jgi:glycosyltransferase involved in cell wall biosynthesis
MAGDGDAAYVAGLRALAMDGPAAGRIEFPGWVVGNQKRELLRSAAVLAAPSHQENFGVSIAEAMASGVPVLITPAVNLSPDVAAATAGWVLPRDLESWEAGLALAMTDSADRRRRAIAARVLAERFQWPSIARQLRDLYGSIAGGRSREPAVGEAPPR